jgi:hypothetical protein
VQQPTTQTVYDLFNGRIQFQVPVYQRAYVWNEDENWSIMWDDIADTADRYMAEPDAHVQNRHFLGPIVLDQEHSEPGGVDPRLVIDGQQRLTTLQLILAATAVVAREHGADEIANELSELTANRGSAAAGDRRFKIWPSRRDRKAFLAMIDADHVEGPATGIPGAWLFFHDSITTWLESEERTNTEDRLGRLQALKVCLEDLLYVVSINLDESDNAQVIFETLNARGTGLGALDLVKNAIFLQAEREGCAEHLHDEWWEPTFEADDYWLDETRQGREKRARADWFLMHWLAMELGRIVRADKLFDTFRKDVLHVADPPSMQALVPQLCKDAQIMRSFDALDPVSPEALFFARLETMDTTTLLPVALFLFRTEEVSKEQRLLALAALESWLVRRAILRLTSRNYNRTLSSLLKAIKGDATRADEAIVRELRSSQANTVIWPSDEAIRLRLEQGEVYGYIGQPRVRMLLEACELDMRHPAKTERIALPEGLSIEHALPQAWEESWPVLDTEDPEAAREHREKHVDRLGNLTLVTQPLNGALSNYPWTATEANPHSKRDELAKRSVLLINHQLCEHDQWDERQIDARSVDLAVRIMHTWPGPDAASWPTTEVANEAAEPVQVL